MLRIACSQCARRIPRWSNAIEQGNGAQGRNRTADTVIFSHVLYQLSYLGGSVGSSAYKGERPPMSTPSESISLPSSSAGGPATR